MDRRAFLKATALAIGVAVAGPSGLAAVAARSTGSARSASADPVTRPVVSSGVVSSGVVAHRGLLYRGTTSGRIETSADQGSTWTLHSNLGSSNPVQSLNVNAGRLVASVGATQRQFNLTLGADAKLWYTAGTDVATARVAS